jgi:hypothetical protein
LGQKTVRRIVFAEGERVLINKFRCCHKLTSLVVIVTKKVQFVDALSH